MNTENVPEAATCRRLAPINLAVVDDLLACTQFSQTAINRAVVGEGVDGGELGVIGNDGGVGLVVDVLS